MKLKRTIYCGEPRMEHVGQEVVISGWVQKRRNLGSLIFIDLRDRTGLLQLVFDTETRPELLEEASKLRQEYVLTAWCGSGAIRTPRCQPAMWRSR